MIRVVIIEDEIPARNKIKRFLSALNDQYSVEKELDSVRDSIIYLKDNQPDLIISDIELLDGNAFEIFDEIEIKSPIIFTTAYNQFLMNAFESNGIAYLLKPFSIDRFNKAIQKFELLVNSSQENTTNLSIDKLSQLLINSNKKSKNRFTIHSAKGIHFVETADIVYFKATEGLIEIVDSNGKKHFMTQYSLKEIEDILSKDDFFRINRSELIQKKYIRQISRYGKNSLNIQFTVIEDSLQTSQSNTASFRAWLEI